eukprot:398677-Pyramimonas_sp.AAC.1
MAAASMFCSRWRRRRRCARPRRTQQRSYCAFVLRVVPVCQRVDGEGAHNTERGYRSTNTTASA